MTSVDLRPATPEDYDFAYRTHCAAMRASVERVYGWDEEIQRCYFDEHFDPAKREIIRYDGNDIGVISVEEQKESLFLALIAILPSYQQRGIGTTLIRRLQERARERGLPVTLRVLRGNPARALYERLGFVLTNESATHDHLKWNPS